MSESVEKRREDEEEERKCPWCLRLVTPIKDEHGLLCPECRNYIVTKTSSRTVRIERPEREEREARETEEDIIAASELSVDFGLEKLPLSEVKMRAPFVIYNWNIRPSRFQQGSFYAMMECEDKDGKKFRWNTSGKAVLATLEEAERRGKRKILVREVLYDEVGGRPVNIRIR